MRPLILLAPATLLLLSACAGGMSGGSSYTSEIERHSAACIARGGILTPTGETTGRVETEYACKINGETARAGH